MSSIIYQKPNLFKFALTWWAPYLGTGISIKHIASDYSSVTVCMKKRWYNSNAFGTHFGGSIYAMCDPFFVLLLVARLGKDYYIWDKAASIEFIRPGSGTLTATFTWTDADVQGIIAQAQDGQKTHPERTVDVLNSQGEVVARVHKTLYVRRKPAKTKV